MRQIVDHADFARVVLVAERVERFCHIQIDGECALAVLRVRLAVAMTVEHRLIVRVHGRRLRVAFEHVVVLVERDARDPEAVRRR